MATGFKDFLSSIASVFSPSPEVQELRYKEKIHKKTDKKFWNSRYKTIFAEADVELLEFMESFVDNNNSIQKIDCKLEGFEYRIKKDDIEENLFQITKKKQDDYYHITYYTRINPVVYQDFCKQFNKYGRNRLVGLKENRRNGTK